MKQNWENKVTIEGYLFDHTLSNRISKKTSTPFIMGDVLIATDEDAMNVVTVHFSYVTETYSKSGKTNPNYGVLQQIIDGVSTYKSAGNSAMKVRINGRIAVNDFYTREGELASPKRVEGSFINVLNATYTFSDTPAHFEAEVVLSGCNEVEPENRDPYVNLSGYAFNFRNDVLPVTFSVQGKAGQKYFLDQDISAKNPLVTKVWGNIISTTVRQEREIESAFGAPEVQTTTRTLRAWDVTGASAEPMEWDDEASITKDELKQALAAREEYLAEVKKNHDEYVASKSGKTGFPAANAGKATVDDDDEDFAF